MTDKVDQILRLCRDAEAASVTSDQGVTLVRQPPDTLRLRNNGISFHELSYREFTACCVGLVQTLLLPPKVAYIDLDHQLFWSWFGEFAFMHRSDFFRPEDREVKELCDAVLRCALLRSAPPVADLHLYYLLARRDLVWVHISFSFLDAMLKRACGEYVRGDGTVIKPFDGQSYDRLGQRRIRKYKIRDRCSSIETLLFLLTDVVASSDADFQAAIAQLRGYLTRTFPGQDPFSSIGNWRNQTLHGEENHSIVAGVILTLSILIAAYSVREDYERWRDLIMRGLSSWNDPTPIRKYEAQFYPMP